MPISILIPTHNRPALLPRAVASALAACPAGGEVLVVDDGSQPSASATLAGVRDDRLRILRHDTARGAAAARNTGAQKARHEVLVFLDDDDEMLPDYIDRLIAQDAFARAEAGFAASLRLSRRTGSERLFRRRAVSGPLPPAASLRAAFFAFSEVPWIRREIFWSIGGIDPVFKTDEDADFCCRLAERGGPLWYEAVAGVRVHRHASSGSAAQLTTRTKAEESVANYLRTYRKNAHRFAPYSYARWFLLMRAIRAATRHRLGDMMLEELARTRPRLLAGAGYLFLGARQLRVLIGRRRAAGQMPEA